MQQEQGCGLGCGIIAAAVAIGLMFLIPFIGVPLGVVAIIGLVVMAILRRKGSDEGDARPYPAGEAGEDSAAVVVDVEPEPDDNDVDDD